MLRDKWPFGFFSDKTSHDFSFEMTAVRFSATVAATLLLGRNLAILILDKVDMKKIWSVRNVPQGILVEQALITE